MSKKTGKYEENFHILEQIADSLNKDEIGIDDLVEKTKEALDSARVCMKILEQQKGEFKKLEADFSRLLEESEKDTGSSLDTGIGSRRRAGVSDDDKDMDMDTGLDMQEDLDDVEDLEDELEAEVEVETGPGKKTGIKTKQSSKTGKASGNRGGRKPQSLEFGEDTPF